MNKVKQLICVLLSLLFLISGCGTDDNTPRDPADVLNVPTQRDIWFDAGNDYYDLYPAYSWMPGPKITLLSRTYIDPEEISVTADIQAEYHVYVHEQKTGAALTSYEIQEGDGTRKAYSTHNSTYDFPLYLYQTNAGMDWKHVGALYAQYCAAQGAYEAGTANAAQLQKADDAFKGRTIVSPY